MNTTNWIAIAALAVATINPWLLRWNESRRNKPKAIPQNSQPQDRSHSTGGRVSRFATSPWPAIIVIILNLGYLWYQLRSPDPLTRSGVLLIIIPVAGIVLNVGFIWQIHLENQLEHFIKMLAGRRPR